MSAPTTRRRLARSIAAEAAFRARVEQLGGQVVGEWVFNYEPVEVTCAAGHSCQPTPKSILQGNGICRTCAGQDPIVAEAAFRTRIAQLGGQVVGEYVNNNTPVACVCAQGHACRPRPGWIQRGGGMCRTCAGKDPVAAERAFRDRIAELDGKVIGDYTGMANPVDCLCPAGHLCQPQPANIQQGKGMCRICVGLDPATAEVAFRTRVTELGGKVLEPMWLGARTPHRALCPQGHLCWPNPSNVRQGIGICAECAGKVWDAFYTVTNPELRRLKFGVTSGDPRPRLRNHHRAGYVDVVRVLPDLPDAHALEQHIRVTLREAGIAAVQGWEYFHIDALAVVLDVVDDWIAA